MINPSFDELSEITPSRYAMCIMASKRARKIVDGSKPLVETECKNPVTLAITEIMNHEVIEDKDVY